MVEGCAGRPRDKYRSPVLAVTWSVTLEAVPTNQAVEDKASGWCGRMLARMFTRLPRRIQQILDST